MSDKDRQKKDGQDTNKQNKKMREAVAERKSDQEPQQMPKDESNHLRNDDE